MTLANDGPRHGWPRQTGEMADLIRSHDWAGSPLGPIEAWPASLRGAVDLCLDSALPCLVWWGDDLLQIPNDAAVGMVAAGSGARLATPAETAWPWPWDGMRAIVDEVCATRAPILRTIPAGPGMAGGDEGAAGVEVSCGPLRTDTGAVAGLFVTVRAKPAQAADPDLARSAAPQILRQAIQRAPVAVMFFDPEGTLVDANEAFLAMTGFSHADVASGALHWRSLTAPEWIAASEREMERMATTGRVGPYEKEYFRKDGTRAWMLFAGSDLGDGSVMEFAIETSDRRRTEDALRASEENLRLTVENARDYAIFTTDPEGIVTAWYDGAAIVFGYRADEIVGRDFAILYTDEDREAGVPRRELAEAARKGRTPNVRWHLRANASRVFIEGAAAALWGGNGELRGFLKIGQDVTERRRAQAALRRSRRELRTLLEGIPQLVWRSRDDGDWTWASPQWVSFTGLSVEASCGLGWLEAVHPDDRERARSAWSKARDAGGFHANYRIREAASGRYRWFQTRATPSREEDGEIAEWFGTSTDVDDLRRLQEHERLLLAELQHRVRNTLAVIRSIARRTANTTETAEDYAMHLEGRIDAFARVQTAVTRDPGAGVSLLDLVAEELVAATAREGENATIEGADVRLPPREAETFGLAVHELATNAIKFGALSHPDGRIAVRWTVEEGASRPILHFVWKETGLHLDPERPRRRGFGTELVERTLSYQLRAEAAETFEPDGVRCTIRMPLPTAAVEEPGHREAQLLEE